jgi:hypothetical protein
MAGPRSQACATATCAGSGDKSVVTSAGTSVQAVEAALEVGRPACWPPSQTALPAAAHGRSPAGHGAAPACCCQRGTGMRNAGQSRSCCCGRRGCCAGGPAWRADLHPGVCGPPGRVGGVPGHQAAGRGAVALVLGAQASAAAAARRTCGKGGCAVTRGPAPLRPAAIYRDAASQPDHGANPHGAVATGGPGAAEQAGPRIAGGGNGTWQLMCMCSLARCAAQRGRPGTDTPELCTLPRPTPT